MHLDCVFSVLSDKCCIMLADIMGESRCVIRGVMWEECCVHVRDV